MESYYLTYCELMQEISDIQYHYLDTDNLPEEVENTLKSYICTSLQFLISLMAMIIA